MNLSIPSIFNASEWGNLLQHFDEEAVDAQGTLTVSGGSSERGKTSFQFTVLKPGSNQCVSLNLAQVISATAEELASCEGKPNTDSMKKNIISGLKHLELRVKDLVERYHLRGQEAHREAMDFYDAATTLIEAVEETPDSRAKKEIAGIASKENITFLEFKRVQEIIKENKNLLFELTPYHESFLDLAASRCAQELFIPLLRDLILDVKALNPSSAQDFKKFLFRNNAQQPTFFSLMMRQEDGNRLFDALLHILSDTELNADNNKKEQVISYAYSVERYEYIFLQESQLPDEITFSAKECRQKAKFDLGALTIIEVLFPVSSSPVKTWSNLRQSSSTTLDAKQSSTASASSQRWLTADQKRSAYAKEHRGSDHRFSIGDIKGLHRLLTEGEEGIENPGKFRKGIVRTSGGWTHLYCPVNYLTANMQHFIDWFNDGLMMCFKEVMNPVIFAAEVYQRFVSIHPFENGNGRMARLLMDYVLERFELPPPILGTEILDALFPLDFKRTDQGKFMRKIIEGIYHSMKVLRDDFQRTITSPVN